MLALAGDGTAIRSLPNTSKIHGMEGLMLQQQNHTEPRADLEWTCQAVSPVDEPCDATATVHCEICGRWFCANHAEDESWHSCVLGEGDEGGEG